MMDTPAPQDQPDAAEEQIHYSGLDRDMRRRIVETTAQLPEAVRDFAHHKVRFFSIGRRAWGSTHPTTALNLRPLVASTWEQAVQLHADLLRARGPAQDWLVLLNEQMLDARSPAEQRRTIAHEIAHGWLGHYPSTSAAERDRKEAEADRLVSQWGFGSDTHP